MINATDKLTQSRALYLNANFDIIHRDKRLSRDINDEGTSLQVELHATTDTLIENIPF